MKCIFVISSIIVSIITNAQQNIEIYREDFDKYFVFDSPLYNPNTLTLKDSLPEEAKDGIYHFYDISIKDSSNILKKTLSKQICGQYLNHMKTGDFVATHRQFNEKSKLFEITWQQVTQYETGQKNGVYKESYFSYKYTKHKLMEVREVTITYIEYFRNLFDGFYMSLLYYNSDISNKKNRLILKFYDKGTLIRTLPDHTHNFSYIKIYDKKGSVVNDYE